MGGRGAYWVGACWPASGVQDRASRCRFHPAFGFSDRLPCSAADSIEGTRWLAREGVILVGYPVRWLGTWDRAENYMECVHHCWDL